MHARIRHWLHEGRKGPTTRDVVEARVQNPNEEDLAGGDDATRGDAGEMLGAEAMVSADARRMTPRMASTARARHFAHFAPRRAVRLDEDGGKNGP